MKINIAEVIMVLISTDLGVFSLLVCYVILSTSSSLSIYPAEWLREVKPGKKQSLKELHYIFKGLGKARLLIERMQRAFSLLSFLRVFPPAWRCLNLGGVGTCEALIIKRQLMCTSASMVKCGRGTVARFLMTQFNIGRFILLV